MVSVSRKPAADKPRKPSRGGECGPSTVEIPCPADDDSVHLVLFTDVEFSDRKFVRRNPVRQIVQHAVGREDAYLDLDDIRALCEVVWAALEVPVPVSRVSYGWTRARVEQAHAHMCHLTVAQAGMAREVSEHERRVSALRRMRRRLTPQEYAARMAELEAIGKDIFTRIREHGGEKQPYYTVRVSKSVFRRLPPDERAATVVHEACHVADFVLNPARVESESHGPAWRRLMARCGLPATVHAKAGRSNIEVKCHSCRDSVHRISVQTAAVLRAEVGVVVCRVCGATLTRHDMAVPPQDEAALARTLRGMKYGPSSRDEVWSNWVGRAPPREYLCRCGKTFSLSKIEYKTVVNSGCNLTPDTIFCDSCGAPMTFHNVSYTLERDDK